ncbi:DUF3549 family protein [Aestuariibacter salexigens]|uniref:DUF3549 family protein n=1 Tax=Aestuariibacter salexigens TaxID=226010 RepID=UPI0004110E06|nr:DUF3549 family protein [Aestuariibacter salexigens]
MSEISTISEFLLHAGTEYRVFDMGRTISELDGQTFLDIEHGSLPVPRPRQGHLWCGIVFFNRSQSAQHYVWFIKLPIDEQSRVVGASRQHFLQIIIDALGDTFEPQNDTQARLPDNPYSFVPSQSLLADFNSFSRATLKLPESQHFAAVQHYLQSPSVIDWRTLAHQGIADLAAKMPQQQWQKRFVEALPSLSPAFLNILLGAMEHYPVSSDLTSTLLNLAREQSDSSIQMAILRALTQSEDNREVNAFITKLLDEPALRGADLLTVIAGRHWHRFGDNALLAHFLETCASVDDGRWFAPLYRDLVAIPDIRTNMLGAIRNPERSDAMSKAIGSLFSNSGASSVTRSKA